MNLPEASDDEAARLDALRRLGVLDPQPEARFDRIVRLAARALAAPMAMISFDDADGGQWSMARLGLDEAAGPGVFLGHLLAGTGDADGGVLTVPDTGVDHRFADDPLVTGPAHVRSFAGSVVREPGGLAVGVLCVLDDRPRHFDDDDVATLADLALLVESELGRQDVSGLVAQLVEAREAAEQVAGRLRLAAGAAGIATALLDETGHLLFANPSFAAVLGHDPDDLLGHHIDEFIDAEDPALAADLVAAMRSGAESLVAYDGRIRADHDGDVRWARVHRGRMARADGGDSELVQVEDTTAARRLEAELRRSEAASRSALDALDQGVILINRHGEVVRANPAAERIMGYSAAEIEHLWRTDHWEPRNADGAPIPLEERSVRITMLTGEPVLGRVVSWTRPDGDRYLVRLSCVPIEDGAGSIVVAFTDITDEHRSRRLLDATLETAPVGLAVLDIDRSIVRCNSMFVRQTGRTVEDLLGMDVTELLIEEPDRESALAVAEQVRATGTLNQARSQPRRVVRPDGTERWITTEVALITDPDQPRGIVATFDVTEQRRLNLDLQRFEYLFRHANDIIAVIDTDAAVLYASPSTGRVLGYPEGWNAAGGVLSLVHPDDAERAALEFAALVAGTSGPEPFTLRIRAASGEWRHLECVGVNLLDEPAVGGIVLTSRDTTERERLTARLAHSATHDDLTDLANRSLLESQLSSSMARAIRDDRRVALCFIDLDGFKVVNDTFGHAAGDQLLVEVAQRIRSSIRGGDLAARFGGDEFVVMIDPVAGADEALIAATRIRDAIIADLSHLVPGIRCGASVGVAVSDLDDTTATLLRRADAALYQAKSLHRSAIELAAESLY